jgi:2-polyprenyl-3-methyl-5-hydroxy-6-metoxy-1,4-benzoquinol methylase
MSFPVRQAELSELMDASDCDKSRLFATYRHFRWMNPVLGNWAYLLKQLIIPYFRENPPTYNCIRLLDIGCGGGDVAKFLDSRLRKAGFKTMVTGIDPDGNAAEFRDDFATFPSHFRFRQHFTHQFLGETFDLIITNHVIHHLRDNELTELANECERLNDGLVLWNDLKRSKTSWWLFSLIGWPLHMNSFAWEDGRVSIKRAFIMAELARLLPNNWEVSEHGLFRLAAILKKNNAGKDGLS